MFDFSRAHCMQCGKAQLTYKQDKALSCPDCGFEYFHNVASAVGAFLLVGNQVLMLQRAKSPGQGKWGVPGGFVDPAETAEQALTREIREEVGVDLDAPLQYLGAWPNQYNYQTVLYHTLDIYYVIRLAKKPDLVLQQSEVMGARWVDLLSIRESDFVFCSAQQALLRAREIYTTLE